MPYAHPLWNFLNQESHKHMHFGTYLVVLKYAEIVMVTHISLSIYLHTKQGQRRVLEFGGDEVIILRNILCQIHDWSEIWKSCQNVVGTIPLAPIYSTSPGQSKSGIDRFSRNFVKVFSRGNFWVLCICIQKFCQTLVGIIPLNPILSTGPGQK